MTVAYRNEQAKQFILDKLELVSSLTEDDFKTLPNFPDLILILNNLICVKAMGFRGIVATAITGKFLNPEYDPLNNFYSCNPRSIFEQGIFYAFEKRIPCGKSDPLNVAKNTNVLNEEWAKGKRPQSAAQAAVDYLRCIEGAGGEEQELIINLFFFKLLEYANSIASIAVDVPVELEISSQIFASKLTDFSLEYPESGTIPQLVISSVLRKLYEKSDVFVKGGDESVFGTNTTSKKPADIWIEYNGKPFTLFEVTVKKVDYKRIDDCIQSLQALTMLEYPVHFICRLPKDAESLPVLTNGCLKYKGKTINFIDIRSFIKSISSLLSTTQIQELLVELQEFVERIERPVKTKEGWNKIFSTKN